MLRIINATTGRPVPMITGGKPISELVESLSKNDQTLADRKVRERLAFSPLLPLFHHSQLTAKASADPDVEVIQAHPLLRQHGQELCKRSEPACKNCPLAADCIFYQGMR